MFIKETLSDTEPLTTEVVVATKEAEEGVEETPQVGSQMQSGNTTQRGFSGMSYFSGLSNPDDSGTLSPRKAKVKNISSTSSIQSSESGLTLLPQHARFTDRSLKGMQGGSFGGTPVALGGGILAPQEYTKLEFKTEQPECNTSSVSNTDTQQKLNQQTTSSEYIHEPVVSVACTKSVVQDRPQSPEIDVQLTDQDKCRYLSVISEEEFEKRKTFLQNKTQNGAVGGSQRVTTTEASQQLRQLFSRIAANNQKLRTTLLNSKQQLIASKDMAEERVQSEQQDSARKVRSHSQEDRHDLQSFWQFAPEERKNSEFSSATYYKRESPKQRFKKDAQGLDSKTLRAKEQQFWEDFYKRNENFQQSKMSYRGIVVPSVHKEIQKIGVNAEVKRFFLSPRHIKSTRVSFPNIESEKKPNYFNKKSQLAWRKITQLQKDITKETEVVMKRYLRMTQLE